LARNSSTLQAAAPASRLTLAAPHALAADAPRPPAATSSVGKARSHAGIVVRAAREAAGMKQEVLAMRLRCSKSHLSLMESGQRTISPQRAAEIERILGIADGRIVHAVQWQNTPSPMRQQLSGYQSLAQRLKQAARRGESLDDLLRSGSLRQFVEAATSNVDDPIALARRVPIINKVAAGYPAEFTDLDYPASVADEYLASPDVTDPHAFAARVVGDSMEPQYREGEIVVFCPDLPTPAGSDCFVRLKRDNQTTFKRIYFEEDGSVIRLQPLNNAYAPKLVRREDVDGMYAAAYVMRKVERNAETHKRRHAEK
jgi:phage repressor protein C with HTH and peptisase S24 domain/ribosome-binding protein aMBF1 (putative translation factor)